MEPTVIEVTGGILSLCYITITLILSIILIYKYFKLQYKEVLYVGMALVGLAGPWFPEGLGFLLILVTGGGLSDVFYLNGVITIFIVFTAYLPVALLFWLSAIMKLVNFEKSKLYLRISLVLAAIFEIVFFVFAIVDLRLIGTFIDVFNSRESTFIFVFYMCSMIILLITAIMFSYVSMKSESRKVRLKGKLFLISMILFLIGGFIATIATDIILLIISRVVLVFCSITLYLGLLLPNQILKLLKITE
ncbi:MAG: hypothetical protein EAX91_00435 [Candidatus Lokiarchaeota archaeon]|nr:hypothetical protein [Candidatus Lokiarchaeota archaeon]